MTERISFRGLGGIGLDAEAEGPADAPTVLLIGCANDAPEAWEEIGRGLTDAGRRVVRLVRTGGDEGAQAAQLRSVLAQLDARPVLVAAARDGVTVAAALASDGAYLAGGLVLIEQAGEPEGGAGAEMPDLALPMLVIRDGGRVEAANAVLLEFLERYQPRAAPEFRSGADPRTLRGALGCFATGVTIVTTSDAEGKPIGLTANSFTSVSLDPPLLLVCIANDSGSAAALRAADVFAVNVLQIGQQPASERFARRDPERFTNSDWSMGELGAPIFAGSLGTFECRRRAVHEGGDHFILVGEVEKAAFEPNRDPLLYFRGKYRRLHFA